MKKILAILLTLTCLWGLSFPALAAEAPAGGTIVYHEFNGVPDLVDEADGPVALNDARFRYFDTLSSSISESKGIAVCTGTVAGAADYKTKLTITIQRSSNGKDWSSQKSWSTDYITGKDRIVLEKSYYLTKGYSYRVITKVEIVDGVNVEKASCESNTVDY